MVSLNTKNMILIDGPDTGLPFVAAVPVEDRFHDVATVQKWGSVTPVLMWIPALTPGVVAIAGFMDEKCRTGSIVLAQSQARALATVYTEFARQNGSTAAIRAYEDGIKVAASGGKQKGDWRPTINPDDYCLMGEEPWDGYVRPERKDATVGKPVGRSR